MTDFKHKDSYSIMVSGDSISKGVVYNEDRGRYTILENNYVRLVQGCLKGMVHNAAKFGSTVIKGSERLQQDVDKSNPDIVLVEYGGNDCDFNWEEIAADPQAVHLPKTGYEPFKQVLTGIIDTLRNKGIVPILMTLPPLDADKYFRWISHDNPIVSGRILEWLGSVTKIYWWQEKYNAAVLSIAEQTRTRLIDVRSAFLQTPDYTMYLCTDGIHPNEAGHRLIGNQITDYVRKYSKFLLKQ